MRMTKGTELSSSDQWEHFKMHYDRLEPPTGQLVTAQQVLTGIALLEMSSPNDRKLLGLLCRFSRAISKCR